MPVEEYSKLKEVIFFFSICSTFKVHYNSNYHNNLHFIQNWNPKYLSAENVNDIDFIFIARAALTSAVESYIQILLTL